MCCHCWTRTASQAVDPGPIAPDDVFHAAVRAAKVGADGDIPHITQSLIAEYVTDLQRLDLV